jgi:hypothetical protein
MHPKRYFLIAGLRARTAWLSTFFTVGEVYCHHDLCAHAKGRVPAALAETPGAVVGSACSGHLRHHEIRAALGNPPTLLVTRPFEEQLASFCRVTRTTEESVEPVLRDLAVQARALRGQPNVIEVAFADLDDEETMRAVWGLLTGHREFPLWHWRKVRTMRVALHDRIMRDAAHPHNKPQMNADGEVGG